MADPWHFVIFVRPSRNTCILRSGVNGSGMNYGSFPLDADGLAKARARASELAGGAGQAARVREIEQDATKVEAIEKAAAKRAPQPDTGDQPDRDHFTHGRVIKKSGGL